MRDYIDSREAFSAEEQLAYEFYRGPIPSPELPLVEFWKQIWDDKTPRNYAFRVTWKSNRSGREFYPVGNRETVLALCERIESNSRGVILNIEYVPEYDLSNRETIEHKTESEMRYNR